MYASVTARPRPQLVARGETQHVHWGPAVEFAPGAVVSGLESLDLAVPGRGGGWEGGRRVSEGRGESWLRDYHSAPAPEHSSQQQDKDMPEMPQMQSGRCRVRMYATRGPFM
jgi:hypothetical protein